LGDVAGEHVGDAPKGDDGEGIGVTDRTLYDLRVHEEMF
jgi:glycyl-tRNA synthetase (class II)